MQVASWGPVQDMTPLMFIKMEFTLAVNCGIIGVLLFLKLLSMICGPFILDDIDDERTEFVRSLAWRGPRLPV